MDVVVVVSPSAHDREAVVEMLRQFRAAQETSLRSEGGGAGGVLMMPRTWTPEMRELERCLGLLGARKPLLHRQVMARYVDPVVSRRTMRGRVRGSGRGDVMVWPELGACSEVRTFAKLPEHSQTSQYSCLVASWPSWVCKPTVELGVDQLVRWFVPRSAVGPAVPTEMLAGRAA